MASKHMEALQKSLPDQDGLSKAEQVLLDLADKVYTGAGLKPMSKTLFFLSRALLTVRLERAKTLEELKTGYLAIKSRLGAHAPEDDYNFIKLVDDSQNTASDVLQALNYILGLNLNADLMGLAFNSLLRGKFEGGEGLGTYLTPEEVVSPMVEMMIAASQHTGNGRLKLNGLYGDICGGTGRFPFSLRNSLASHEISPSRLVDKCFLFDQSKMAVDFAKINFLLENDIPEFFVVEDSLTSKEVSKLKGKFQFLATNPPFGTGKYCFNPAILTEIHPAILGALSFSKMGDSIDPALLFVFRNLDLLQKDGILGIVLPDGVLKSDKLQRAVAQYEAVNKCHINCIAEVSLPVGTFALAGTVAKTSFAIYQKSSTASKKVFKLQAHHIGFLKKGNRRIADPKGNELEHAVEAFAAQLSYSAEKSAGVAKKTFSGKPLKDYVRLSKQIVPIRAYEQGNLHLSILDVDETGFIEILNTAKNLPTTKPQECRPGDILISCINPKIWRVALVPAFDNYSFTCSPEFAVLRPIEKQSAPILALLLMKNIVKQQAISLAKGTSSSRQRINKKELLGVVVPDPIELEKIANKILMPRFEFYAQRLKEHSLLCDFLSRN